MIIHCDILLEYFFTSKKFYLKFEQLYSVHFIDLKKVAGLHFHISHIRGHPNFLFHVSTIYLDNGYNGSRRRIKYNEADSINSNRIQSAKYKD